MFCPHICAGCTPEKYLICHSGEGRNPENMALRKNLAPETNCQLMQDRRFNRVSARDKTSIKDAILGDLQRQFSEVDPQHLSHALQIMLLRNTQSHGLLSFTETADPRNPFHVSRSAVDEFFQGVAHTVGGAASDPWCALAVGECFNRELAHGCQGEGAVCCCCCVVGAAALCCACWTTAKSVEVATRVPGESNSVKTLKLLIGLILAAAVYGLTVHYAGEAFGDWVEGDSGSSAEYEAGRWGIPFVMALMAFWISNCVAGQVPCVPRTAIPPERRAGALMAYGEQLFETLKQDMGGREATDLMDELRDSTIPEYLTRYPITSSAGDKALAMQKALFAQEVIGAWIRERSFTSSARAAVHPGTATPSYGAVAPTQARMLADFGALPKPGAPRVPGPAADIENPELAPTR